MNNLKRFVTTDYWESRELRDRFREEFATKFDELDRFCESFTTEERFLGDFDIQQG